MKEIIKPISAAISHEINSFCSDDYKQKIRQSLDCIFDETTKEKSPVTEEERISINMVGFTHSGKTTVVENLKENFQNLVEIKSDRIHDIINNIFPQLKDDQTIDGKGYWLRQFITNDLRKKITKDFCKKGYQIINDSCNLNSNDRQKRLKISKSFNYKTILIWVKCSEEEILNRIDNGNNPQIYRDLYCQVQKPIFEEPKGDEADLLLVFESGKNNLEQDILPFLIK